MEMKLRTRICLGFIFFLLAACSSKNGTITRIVTSGTIQVDF